MIFRNVTKIAFNRIARQSMSSRISSPKKVLHINHNLSKDNKRNWETHEKLQDFNTNTELARELEKEEDECLFPFLQKLNIETNLKVHYVNAKCGDIIRYIKLGAINKNLAIQYCHYLAHLGRVSLDSGSEEDSTYYFDRAFDLMTYLLRNTTELTEKARIILLCDIANTSTKNCISVCQSIMKDIDIIDKLSARDLSKLLSSCYFLDSFETANNLLEKTNHIEVVNPRIFDPLILGLFSKTSKEVNDVDKKPFSEEERKVILEHLFRLIELSSKYRVQFITKHLDKLLIVLENLRIKVSVNPVIKMSGRCTHCDTKLPIYDCSNTVKLNEVIKTELNKQDLKKNLHLNSTSEDLIRFEEFLKDMNLRDKRPIDCVIDGLNVCYRNSTGFFIIKKEVAENVHVSSKRHNPGAQVQILVNTMLRNNMLQLYKKILVIGKKHMSKWPGLIDFFERNKIYYYFSANEAKDDLFQLYAASLSPNTTIVTNDFFRDHLSLLFGEERRMLERWIDTHQVWILNRNLKAIWPTPFEKVPSLDRKTGYFHIPVVNYHKLDIIANHEPPPHLNNKIITWLCCRDMRLNELQD